MKRIIFLILVILFLSLPVNALYFDGFPVQLVVTLNGYSGIPIILNELNKAIRESSTYCPFDGQSARIRIDMEVKYDGPTDTYNYKIQWRFRLDERSLKFTVMDTATGSYKLGDERKTAIAILDHTDELLEPDDSGVILL